LPLERERARSKPVRLHDQIEWQNTTSFYEYLLMLMSIAPRFEHGN